MEGNEKISKTKDSSWVKDQKRVLFIFITKCTREIGRMSYTLHNRM
ncbi:hypothetical protein MtrunA17_Chr2g0311971 [Medicago truncatula]|uniref:Uncharacterized protein n=1 Tax=Medicago truncatula TaxID=3880 RepID=A0A396JBZ4_MEDTR|nr:hypothetical protein MtrunA17_Chr2g0311971 [Medicago truncatula]